MTMHPTQCGGIRTATPCSPSSCARTRLRGLSWEYVSYAPRRASTALPSSENGRTTSRAGGGCWGSVGSDARRPATTSARRRLTGSERGSCAQNWRPASKNWWLPRWSVGPRQQSAQKQAAAADQRGQRSGGERTCRGTGSRQRRRRPGCGRGTGQLGTSGHRRRHEGTGDSRAGRSPAPKRGRVGGAAPRHSTRVRAVKPRRARLPGIRLEGGGHQL